MSTRRAVLAAVAAAVLALTAVAPAAQAAPSELENVRSVILEQTNAQRGAAGLQPLREMPALDAFAQQCSQRQGDAATIFHCEAPGDFGSAWAENVALGQRPDQVVAAWMNSEGHRRNIMNPSYTHIGIGFVVGASGRTHFTQNFQRPRTDAGAAFVDVSARTQSVYHSSFASEIGWTASRGISSGWTVAGHREFRPWEPIARDAMAAFLYRYAGSPTTTPPASSRFADVPVEHPFYREISWLASTGVTTGWDGPNGREFRPQDPITRDAMAAFLHRFASLRGSPGTGSASFVDVPPSSSFAIEISWLASAGVTTGWSTSNGTEFRPYAPVTRDAMAAFLQRFDRWSATR